MTGKRWPTEITEADLVAWCTATGANNTVRTRLSTVRTFFGWCVRHDIVSTDPTLDLDRLRKQYPKVYGKVQGAHPARFLSEGEATRLLDTCKDGTWIGSRDQLAIRLGLMGVRSAECTRMTWGNLTPDGRLSWIGKGRRQRTVSPGPTFTAMLAKWRGAYEQALGRPVDSTDPLLCREVLGAARQGGPRRIQWAHPMAQRTFYALVQTRARRAGLGHVAPHDLRHSAANILHNTRTPDGGHVYDLLDIQQVLDHADPATTQRSYISQMSSDVKRSAGETLDF